MSANPVRRANEKCLVPVRETVNAPVPCRSLQPRDFILPGLLVLGAGVLFACSKTARPVGNPRVPEPAKSVHVKSYLGRWYEIARYEVGFERDCEGVTADYSVRPDGLVRVVNTCREGSPNGPVRAAEAKARIVEGSGNAKLKVSFFGPFFVGDYWVLDRAEDYTWSIVGEPSGKYLWLLSRDATPPPDVTSTLIERVRALGYDTSMLRMTRQPPG